MTPATVCADLPGDAPEANTPDACDGAVGPCSIGTGSHRPYYAALDAAGTCRLDPESVDPTACAEAPEPTAKGCHWCPHRVGQSLACWLSLDSDSVASWQAAHLSDDLLTPKPNAPECPGRVER